jgi:catechol 2,3-dioxygenase-like lactoylglutathione lyase family enzyme
MITSAEGFLEHVAIRVHDLAWYVDFFRDVLRMTVTEVDGDPDSPTQIWTVGGLQLIATPDFEGREGRLAHLGILVDDLDGAAAAAIVRGAEQLPAGRGWLATPDGLCLELIQAAPGAVEHLRANRPRLAASPATPFRKART